MTSPIDISALRARIFSFLTQTPVTLPYPTASVAAVIHAVNLARGLQLRSTTAVEASGAASSAAAAQTVGALPPWNSDACTLTYVSGKNEATFRVRVGLLGPRIQVDAVYEVSGMLLQMVSFPLWAMGNWRGNGVFQLGLIGIHSIGPIYLIETSVSA